MTFSIIPRDDPQKAQEELQFQKAYFEGLVDNMPDAIAIFDDDGTVTEINTQFSRMFGYLEDEALAKILASLWDLRIVLKRPTLTAGESLQAR